MCEQREGVIWTMSVNPAPHVCHEEQKLLGGRSRGSRRLVRGCNRVWEGRTQAWTRVGLWSKVGGFWTYSEAKEQALLWGHMCR